MADYGSASALRQMIFAEEMWLLESYTGLSAVVFWILDLFQTLPMEIMAIWSKRLSGVSILFLINRYVFLFCLSSSIFPRTPGRVGSEVCRVTYTMGDIASIVTVLSTGCLLAFRVYVIYGRHRLILAISSLFILSRLAMDISKLIISQGISSEGTKSEAFSRCQINVTVADEVLFIQLTAVVSFLSLTFDSFVFTLSLRKTYHAWKGAHRLNPSTITQLLLRDGVIYFFIMVVIALVEASIQILSLRSNGKLSLRVSTFNQTFSPYFNTIPNVLINRIVLNLRLYDQSQRDMCLDTVSLPQLAFAQNPMLGNIRAPLEASQWDDVALDEDILGSENGRRSNRRVEVGPSVKSQDPLETTVPVVYLTHEDAEIHMIPIDRDGPSKN